MQSSPLKPTDVPPEAQEGQWRATNPVIESWRQSHVEANTNEEPPSAEITARLREKDHLASVLRKLQEDVAFCEQQVEEADQAEEAPLPNEEAFQKLV